MPVLAISLAILGTSHVTVTRHKRRNTRVRLKCL